MEPANSQIQAIFKFISIYGSITQASPGGRWEPTAKIALKTIVRPTDESPVLNFTPLDRDITWHDHFSSILHGVIWVELFLRFTDEGP